MKARMTQRMWRSDLRAGPFAKLRRRGRGRIQPVETHQQEVLEENDHVLTVGGDRVSLEEVVDNAGKERGALHVEGHGVESRHVAVHHNLENLGTRRRFRSQGPCLSSTLDKARP